jgi:hypothetical protein
MGSALDEAEALFGAPAKKKPSALEEAEALPAPSAREKTSAPMAGLLGGAQGGSFGTADEGVGAMAGLARFFGIGNKDHEIPRATTREGKPIDPATLSAVNRRNAANPALRVPEREETVAEAYRGGRDSAREDLEQARTDQPVAAYGAEIGASILNPVKAPIKGSSFLAKLGRGAAEGAAYGAGTSNADLTRGDVGGFAKDTATGLATGGAIAGAGAAAGAGVKAGAGYLKDTVKRRVLNEIGEAPSGKRATPTAYKRLDKSGDSIVAEVIDGPDGDLVRQAYSGPAAKGREVLTTVLGPLKQQNEEAYAAFNQAGRGAVNSTAYHGRLMAASQEAAARGEGELARGLKHLADDFGIMVGDAGQDLDLRALRRFTSQTQRAASQALGSLTETTSAPLKNQLSRVATEHMDDLLTDSAAGRPDLEQAAAAIRANNRRISGLATVDDTLKARAVKENTEKGFIQRTAENVATSSALGGAAGFVGGDEDRFTNALEGMAAGAVLRKGIPAAGRLAERGVTSMAIRAARGGGGEGPARVARTVAPMFVRMGIGARREDEERKRR